MKGPKFTFQGQEGKIFAISDIFCNGKMGWWMNVMILFPGLASVSAAMAKSIHDWKSIHDYLFFPSELKTRGCCLESIPPNSWFSRHHHRL